MKKILIIEDETSLTKILADELIAAGFDVSTVFDGRRALQTLKIEHFDLILLDLILPNVDGFEILAETKKMKIKAPIIVLSNLGQKEDIQKSMDLGATEYFVKSNVTVSSIVDFVTKFLKQ
jgi:DNA-binding response OmpR family regulator